MSQGAFLKWMNRKFSFFFINNMTEKCLLYYLLCSTWQLVRVHIYIFFFNSLNFKVKALVWNETLKSAFCVNVTVSIVSVVFAIAGEKKDPVLPAHFCNVFQKPQTSSTHRFTGLLHWRGKLQVTHPHPQTPQHSSSRASVRLRLSSLSPPMQPVSAMMPALAPAVTFCRLFVFPYVHVSIL